MIPAFYPFFKLNISKITSYYLTNVLFILPYKLLVGISHNNFRKIISQETTPFKHMPMVRFRRKFMSSSDSEAIVFVVNQLSDSEA